MRKYLTIIMLIFVPSLLMAQAAGGAIKRPTKNTAATTPQKKREKMRASNNTAGYDVNISCNEPSATLSVDGDVKGNASGTIFLKTGSHRVMLSAYGYEPLWQTIVVNSSSTSFSFSMKPLAQSLSPILKDLVNNMIYVEGGTFLMGATTEQGNLAYDDEKPITKVTLSSFCICKYEVTQEEWIEVMGNNPSHIKGTTHPVESVTWEDCQNFINKLNDMTGMRFRLPTEAEWEYAARGGKLSIGYKYAGSNNLEDIAWYHDINHDNSQGTHPVGLKSPNELGLYDMSGNVWEWCQDWKGSYFNGSQINPKGPNSGSNHVRRGGSWLTESRLCRTSNRHNAPLVSDWSLGLRLALECL